MSGELIEAMPSNFKLQVGSLTLRSKILLMILPVALVSMGAAAYIGFASAETALTQEAFNQVTAIRNAKKTQLESYFRTLRDTFSIFGADPGVASAAESLGDGFDRLDGDLPPEKLEALRSFYRETFVPTLSKSPGFEETTVAEVLPRDGKAAELQSLYIVDNPYKSPDRDKFVESPAKNPYTEAHAANHLYLKEIADKLKLEDLFIVSDRGRIIYSSEKQVEFGTSLDDGPYANSGLGHLFKDIINRRKNGLIELTDYSFYMPMWGAPTMFIGTPIYVGYRLVGVLIGQVSTDEVNRTLNGGRSWRADGLGNTGNAYVTGPGHDMRNDHRVFLENPDQFFAAAAAQGYKPGELDAMRRDGTTILRYRINTEGIRRALEGQSGTVAAPNTLGNVSLQAYAPLDIPDLNWVLNANIERAEILAPVEQLKRTMLIVACVLTLLVTLLAIWMASRFVRPINALMAGIDQIRSGKADVQVPRHADDEFGKLAGSFNAMAMAIKERDEIIDGKTKAYAGLLHRVFPEVVANRMRSGEEQTVDALANVTLIYVDAVGFLRAAESLGGIESVKLLDTIIDRFDNLADRLGIEPVKSIGEHYIAACGLATPRLDHALRVVEFADAAAGELKLIGMERRIDLSMRASVDSGAVHAGLVGSGRFIYDVWGRPLSNVRQMIQTTPVGEIRITDEVHRQLGSDSGFQPRPPSQTVLRDEIVCFGRPPRSAGQPGDGAGAAAPQLIDA